MADLSKATPRPWNPDRPRGYSVGRGFGIDPDVEFEESKANGALIVHAVNCHDNLVSGLRGLLDLVETIDAGEHDDDPVIVAARSALADAEAV